MKLAALELFLYSLPLKEPLSLAGETLHRREGILVRMRGDGEEAGWGEASPLPGFSEESLDEVAGQLRASGKSLAGREIPADFADPSFSRESGQMELAPSARFGMELAILNLIAASRGAALSEMLSRRPAKTVWLNGLLSGSTEDVLEDACRMRSAGYRAVKLKVGSRSVQEDAELVRAVSEVPGGVSLRLDANRAWSFEEAKEFADAISGLRCEYVEEPLREPALLARFVRETGTAVALDESLVGLEPEDLSNHAYARAIVLKPTLLGGVSRALRLAERARSLGLTPVVSSAYETGVGTLGLISLAAALGEAPAGLDTYRRLAEDVLEPPLDLRPAVEVAETLGLRREVAHGSLEPIG